MMTRASFPYGMRSLSNTHAPPSTTPSSRLNSPRFSPPLDALLTAAKGDRDAPVPVEPPHLPPISPHEPPSRPLYFSSPPAFPGASRRERGAAGVGGSCTPCMTVRCTILTLNEQEYLPPRARGRCSLENKLRPGSELSTARGQ